MAGYLFEKTLCCGVPFSQEVDLGSIGLNAVSPPSWFTMTPTTGTSYMITVEPNCNVASWVIDVEAKEGEPYGQILIVIEDCPPDAIIELCLGEIGPSGPLPGGSCWQLLGDPPPFMILTYSGDCIISGQAIGVGEPGSYQVNFYNGSEYLIIIVKITDCRSRSICGPCITNIAWFNHQGGWQSYPFVSNRGRKSFTRDSGEETTFKNGNPATGEIALHTSQLQNVYDGVTVVSGFIPASDLDYVERLKQSIQQYLWNEDTGAFDIPVKINRENFTLKRCNVGFYSYSFSFVYASEVIVQTQ